MRLWRLPATPTSPTPHTSVTETAASALMYPSLIAKAGTSLHLGMQADTRAPAARFAGSTTPTARVAGILGEIRAAPSAPPAPNAATAPSMATRSALVASETGLAESAADRRRM